MTVVRWALASVAGMTLLAVPTVQIRTEPAVVRTCQSGRISQVTLPTMGSTAVAGRVYLPAGYSPSHARLYPMLILLHGANATDEQWADIGIAAAADGLICAGGISSLVIVLPDGGRFVPPEIDDYVVGTLLPWLTSSYRVAVDAGHRSIGGISRGGGAALRIGAAHPELFASVGGHSAALDRSVASLVPGLRRLRGGVFLDVGKKDGLIGSVSALSVALRAVAARNELHVWPGSHDRPYWRAHTADYLRFYSASWTRTSPTS